MLQSPTRPPRPVRVLPKKSFCCRLRLLFVLLQSCVPIVLHHGHLPVHHDQTFLRRDVGRGRQLLQLATRCKTGQQARSRRGKEKKKARENCVPARISMADAIACERNKRPRDFSMTDW